MKDKGKHTSLVISPEIIEMIQYIKDSLGIETTAAVIKMAIYQYYRTLRSDQEIKTGKRLLLPEEKQ